MDPYLVLNIHTIIKSPPQSNSLVLMLNKMKEERGPPLANENIISLNYSFSVMVLFLSKQNTEKWGSFRC